MQKIERRYTALLGCLPTGAVSHESLRVALKALLDAGFADLGARLRVLRQITLHRLYQWDCEQGAPLETILQGMTALAELCLNEARAHTYAELCVQQGAPTDPTGKPCQMWIVGMGKLGARELNVSSDIDLIFVHEHDTPSHQTFFSAQARLIQNLLAQVTEYGFVFRVDLALRPYGRDGTLAMSLKTLAQYFQRAGREWERFAWLKSRVIQDKAAPAEASNAIALRAVVRSFVFRRFLDHKVFASLQELHQLIRKNAHPVHGVRDVKLGRGGIREIEFAAQVQQIVRGGRQPELLTRPTLAALQRLVAAGLMSEGDARTLTDAYDFLRRTEHRIQYLDDQQTHLVPAAPAQEADLAWLAHSMGFASTPLFEAALAEHRSRVAVIFDAWLSTGLAPAKTTVTLSELQAKAAWTVPYLRKHPDVADELARPDVLTTRFDAQIFQRKVKAQYAAQKATGLCDEETVLDLLRRAHHIEVFRMLVRDAQGLLSVRDVGDELSSLADSVLALALPWCWEALPTRLCEAARAQGRTAQSLDERFCVIAYGKLGGKELGYGSDLDLVFLYDDESDVATELYVALVRKLITWLTVKTGEGDLYEIDTVLRPNGNSGLLVTSIASYEKYQLQLGSNAAWTWELQAMTRARCVLGGKGLAARFDAVRGQVLAAQRAPTGIRSEIAAMRCKLYAAYAAPAGQFDIKHSPGGMMDTEFAVQCLVLLHAADHPALLANVGNIELLKIAEAAQLLPGGVGANAADAYQLLRDKQHAARLQAVKAVLPESELPDARAAITALWQTVFG